MGRIQQRIIDDDYRISAGGAVAYIDESYSTPNDRGKNFYILTAVVVAQPARDDLRRGIVEMVKRDDPECHWHTTDVLQERGGLDRAKEMLEYVVEGGEVCVVTVNQDIDPDDRDGDRARQVCFQRVLPELEQNVHGHGQVTLAILEARRDGHQKAFDALLHRQMIKSGLLSEQFRMRQASPGDENLLWLPDVVCTAVRKRTIGKTEGLFEIIEPAVIWV